MNLGRRKAINSIFQAMGLVAIGGLAWSAYISEAKSNPLWLYPPGARENFANTCIKCGLCVEACPYYTLKLSTTGNKGLPIFQPRDIPCFMCEDIPCASACPTDALDIKLLSSNGKLDISKAKMGVAVVDTLNCIAYAGIQCDACYRACPLIDKAIYLEYKANERTGKHSMILPMVANDVCTGCGKCEKACITEIASIRVLPRDVILGKMGSNYIKGWEEADEKRLENVSIKPKTDSKKQAIDYLNEEF
ncbi:ferredoxin-type protein NapG [Helicobacter anseris]|uniref:Ferredoxin-type protein NapG n=1 Tax=Helicobacter anseris TaxID=375926 RepID=A0A3D8J691_9HELI|nr:ferredoxin-type protein NapG [Helicobacter anseris]RDU72636.1 ferredoxin-type protein NapG [Helicobacter anseris]